MVPPRAQPCPALGPTAGPCPPSPDAIYKVPRGSGTQLPAPGDALEVRARGSVYVGQGQTTQGETNCSYSISRSMMCPPLPSEFPPVILMTPLPPFPALWAGLPHSPLERRKLPMMCLWPHDHHQNWSQIWSGKRAGKQGLPSTLLRPT